jgi:hypothetical protein
MYIILICHPIQTHGTFGFSPIDILARLNAKAIKLFQRQNLPRTVKSQPCRQLFVIILLSFAVIVSSITPVLCISLVSSHGLHFRRQFSICTSSESLPAPINVSLSKTDAQLKIAAEHR